MMLSWIPIDIPLPGMGLPRIGYRLLQEAQAADRLAIESMLWAERMVRARAKDFPSLPLRPNRAPTLPWVSDTRAEPLLVFLSGVKQTVDRVDLLGYLNRHAPLQFAAKARFDAVMHDPARTARLGYLCCLRASRQEGLQSEDFSRGLALVALGSVGMQLQQKCEMCFRWALPGQMRCDFDSRSAKALREDGPSDHKRRAHVRAASKVMRALGDSGPLRDLDSAKRLRARQLHGALLGRPQGSEDEWRARVAAALESAPTVQSRLPSDFDLGRLDVALRGLRRCLDPLEHDPWAWPEKITKADAWLVKYKAIAPGRPPKGPQPRTEERLARYRALEREGLTKKQIARALGMTMRAMEAMLRRHDDRVGN